MKKAAINLSVQFIVIIILALVFLGLGLGFMRQSFDSSTVKLEEQIVAGVPGPEVEISAPNDGAIIGIGDTVDFRGFAYTTTDMTIISYNWDFQGDGQIDSTNQDDQFTYFEPGDYKVVLKVLNNLGGIGEEEIEVRVFNDNHRLDENYVDDPVFFIPSIRSGNEAVPIDNWEDILRIIPLTRWFDHEGDHSMDLVAVQKGSGGQITADDIQIKLDEFGKSQAVVFDASVSLPDGYSALLQDSSDLNQYFSWWTEYDSVVATSQNNQDGTLIAALFASYYNSPIIFLPESDSGFYDQVAPFVTGKRLYIIDEIPSIAQDRILSLISDQETYTTEELKDPQRQVNRIVELKAKIN